MDKITTKKIVITGANGFLGHHLTKRLSGKYNLITPSSSELDVTSFKDFHGYLFYHQPDYVIHLAAACGGIGANQKFPADFFFKNSQMSLNVLSACQNLNIKKLITLGSVCSYPKFTPVPFKEEDIWNGYPEETNAPYGIAKKNLLVGCKAYNDQYGSNFIHLIPVNMYGEHDNFNPDKSHVIPALLEKFIEAKKNGDTSVTVWGDGTASREFLYAGDCAKAIELSIEGYNSPDPINIGTGKEISIKDLVTLIKGVVGYTGEINFDTSKPNGQPRRCLDTSKAKKELGFVAETSFKEGLEKTYNWYMDFKSQ